jgi:hypothetical protein
MGVDSNMPSKSILSLKDVLGTYYEIDYYVDNVSVFNWANSQVGVDPEDGGFESTIHVKVVVYSKAVETIFEVFTNLNVARMLGLSEPGHAAFFPEEQLCFGF